MRSLKLARTLEGITTKRFKGVKRDSKNGYGFNVQISEDNTFDCALFFESAINLLSFIDYTYYHEHRKLKRCILISMAGLEIDVLKHSLKIFAPNSKVFLCVGNDNDGREFIRGVDKLGIDYGLRLPDGDYKDWNEQVSEIKFISATTETAMFRIRICPLSRHLRKLHFL